MSHLVAPSLLSADFTCLERDIRMVNESRADWIHVDVMDGVFVPNISFGMPVIKAIKKVATLPLDVHLMIVEPERYIKQFREVGADILTIHYEATNHLHSTVQSIHAAGMKAGVVLNPHTSVQLLEDILPDLDLVLIMSVNPGFGGQRFIEQSFHKISKLRELIAKTNSRSLIEVDGGVTLENKNALLDAGADILVAGNTVFGSGDPIRTIELLKE